MQLGTDAATFGVVLRGGETLAEERYFVVTGAAPANFRPAAGC
jgi:hypothetical protein